VTTPVVPDPPVLPDHTSVLLNDRNDALILSTPYAQLAAGKVWLYPKNYGMDDHDLTVSRDGEQIAQVYLTPGAETTLEVDLAPGIYRFYCSLYNGAHDAAGMNTTIVAR